MSSLQMTLAVIAISSRTVLVQDVVANKVTMAMENVATVSIIGLSASRFVQRSNLVYFLLVQCFCIT